MEVWRGDVTDLKASEAGSKVACGIAGHGSVVLHRDLDAYAADGDEVVVAGPVKNGEMAALAICRVKDCKVAFIDSSNHVLLLGFMGFMAIFLAILGMKASGLGGETLAMAYTVGSLTATGLLVWVVFIMIAIRKAASAVEHRN